MNKTKINTYTSQIWNYAQGIWEYVRSKPSVPVSPSPSEENIPTFILGPSPGINKIPMQLIKLIKMALILWGRLVWRPWGQAISSYQYILPMIIADLVSPSIMFKYSPQNLVELVVANML